MCDEMYPKNLIHSQTHKSHDTPRFLMIGKCINLNDKCVNLPAFHTTTTTPPPLPDFEKLESLDKLVPDIPKIKRFVGKPNPMTFTKNWYSKPTSPDMQSEERLFRTQFFVSIDKLYERNSDGLLEQEVLYKMYNMSMVANAYVTNHNLDHGEIVDLHYWFFWNSSSLVG